MNLEPLPAWAQNRVRTVVEWSSGSTTRRIVAIAALVGAMALVGYVILSFLEYYAGWLILIALIWAFFAWRKHKQEQQRRAYEAQRRYEFAQEQKRAAWEHDREEQTYQDWLRRQQAQAELRHQEWVWREEQRRNWEQQDQEEAETARQEREREQSDMLAGGITLRQMLDLTPTQFEMLVVELLKAWGHTDVHHVGGSGDLGADVTSMTPEGEFVVVQCKRYAPGNLVGSPEMQKFVGMAKLEHRADKAIFITTSGFSAPADELGRKHGIQLITGEQLVHYARIIHFARQSPAQTLPTTATATATASDSVSDRGGTFGRLPNDDEADGRMYALRIYTGS